MKVHSSLLVLLGVALSTTALSAIASAADLPTHKEAPAPAPYVAPFTWTGFYIGGYVGGSFGSVNYSDPVFAVGGNSPVGFSGGGLAGYNYQFSQFVLGLEGEYGWLGWSGNSVNSTGIDVNGNAFNLTQKFDDAEIGRVRGRLGWAVQPQMLLFVAGGWSFANSHSSISGTCCGFAAPFSVSNSKDFDGWNIGVGAEYAFTQNWIGRVEYIYDGFSRASYSYAYAPAAFVDNRSVSYNLNTVRAALEYKF